MTPITTPRRSTPAVPPRPGVIPAHQAGTNRAVGGCVRPHPVTHFALLLAGLGTLVRCGGDEEAAAAPADASAPDQPTAPGDTAASCPPADAANASATAPVPADQTCEHLDPAIDNFPHSVTLCHPTAWSAEHLEQIATLLKNTSAFVAHRMASLWKIPAPSDHLTITIDPLCLVDMTMKEIDAHAAGGVLDTTAGDSITLRPFYYFANTPEECYGKPSSLSMTSAAHHLVRGLATYYAARWLPPWLAGGLAEYEHGAYRTPDPYAINGTILTAPFAAPAAPVATFPVPGNKQSHTFTHEGVKYGLSVHGACDAATEQCQLSILPKAGGGAKGFYVAPNGDCGFDVPTQLIACIANGAAALPDITLYSGATAQRRTTIGLGASQPGKIAEQQRYVVVGPDGPHFTHPIHEGHHTYDAAALAPGKFPNTESSLYAAGLTIVGLEAAYRQAHPGVGALNAFYPQFGALVTQCRTTCACPTILPDLMTALDLPTDTGTTLFDTFGVQL